MGWPVGASGQLGEQLLAQGTALVTYRPDDLDGLAGGVR
jgi:hypothetical protein